MTAAALKITPADREAYRKRNKPRSVSSPEMTALRDRLAGKTFMGNGEFAKKMAGKVFRPRDLSYRERLKARPAPKQAPRLQWHIDQERGYCDWPCEYAAEQ